MEFQNFALDTTMQWIVISYKMQVSYCNSLQHYLLYVNTKQFSTPTLFSRSARNPIKGISYTTKISKLV